MKGTSKNKEQGEKKTEQTEQTTQERWANYRKCNICIMGMPQGKEKNKQKKY